MVKKFEPETPKDYVDYGDAGTDKRADASSADTQSFTATTTASLITGAVVYLNKLKDRGTIPKGWFQRVFEDLRQRLGRRKSSNEIDDSAELARMADLKAVAVARGASVRSCRASVSPGIAGGCRRAATALESAGRSKRPMMRSVASSGLWPSQFS